MNLSLYATKLKIFIYMLFFIYEIEDDEKSVFLDYFGDSPLMKILDFLIESRDK